MSVHLRTFLSALTVYIHYMYVFLLSLLLDGILLYWVFVCVCCAAPDKLTSPPPFTGLGAFTESISDPMIADFNVVCPCMKHLIFHKTNNIMAIILDYHRSLL